MKHHYIAMLLSMAAFSLWADAPEGYYNSLEGLRDQSLKDKLHEISINHRTLTYNSLWDYYPETDAYPERVNGRLLVWDMYSDNWNTQQYYYYGGTSGLNREHSVPKSWWGSGNDAIYNYTAGTDIMHIVPSDGEANMAKSNYPLGEVDETTFDNGTSMVGFPVAGQGGGSSRVFEPDDEYKGDFARIYFYMVTCYQDYEWRKEYGYMFTNSTYLSLQNWATDLLLDWSRNDPVSQKEIDRNDAVYKIQGNRNPFVDDPELVEYIWGNRKGEEYSLEHYEGDPGLTSPVHDSQLNFGEVAAGSSKSMQLLVKGNGITSKVGVAIYSYDHDMFDIATKSIPAANVNSSVGYNLTVTYSPTEVGSHKTRLLLSFGNNGQVGIDLIGATIGMSGMKQAGADRGRLIVSAYEGGLVRFTCSTPHTGGRIYDISGRLVRTLPTIEHGTMIDLPRGAYIVITDQQRTPVKILVR